MARRARPLACFLVAVAAPLAGPVAAQVSPNGDQFQVNTVTTGAQFAPVPATDGAGRVIVAWESDSSAGTDNDLRSIQARRYGPSGAPLGDQFQVNTYITGWQSLPWVAAESSGAFVVVWGSDGSPGTDSSGGSVQARRYGPSGTPLGDQFQVNTYTTSWQGEPRVAAIPAGGFVVVWTSDGSAGSDASTYSVQGQRYGADGQPLGGEFQVNSYTTGYQMVPAVAASTAGGFVVVWTSDGSAGTDTLGYSVQAQRYDAVGAALGTQFQVNTYTPSYQGAPDVAVTPAGNFVVVWASDGSAGADVSSYSVQARRYAASGVPAGPEFEVNTYTTNYQGWPAIAADGTGDFVVTWPSYGSAGTDNDWFSIQARRFGAGGAPASAEFQANTYTTSGQWPARVSADARGNFVLAWGSFGSFGNDNDQGSAQARRYDDLFRDGFESGATARWTQTLP